MSVGLGPSRDGSARERDVHPPTGSFYVAYAGGVPIASGGWRGSAEDGPAARRSAEVKRVYVVPEWTRRGLARQMLAHLELTAAAAGYDQLILSTGPRQPEAIALYRSAGYVDIAPFGYYGDHEADVVTFLGKRLTDQPVPPYLRPFVLPDRAPAAAHHTPDYDLYLPEGATEPVPVVVFQHGLYPATWRPSPREWPLYGG